MLARAFLSARGARQGDIKGDVTLKGREGSIALILGGARDRCAPYDQATGLYHGKRVHKPVVVVTAIDQSTPKLFAALIANEVQTSVKIEFWRPAPEIVAPHFVIALTNAAIVAIELAPALQPHDRDEWLRIHFTYEKITWTYGESGNSFEDNSGRERVSLCPPRPDRPHGSLPPALRETSIAAARSSIAAPNSPASLRM